MMEIVKGLIGNALTSTAADHVVAVTKDIYDEKQERYQDDINNHLLEQVQNINDSISCFSNGLWENLLHWSNIPLWDNNKFAIAENLQQQITNQQKTHATDIGNLTKHLQDSDDTLSKAVADNNKKHEAINSSLSKHNQQIKDIENLIQEHDQQITDLLNGLCCFGDGQWNNELKWSNDALWENSNLMCDTFSEVYNLITEHKKIIQELNGKIERIKQEADESLRLINNTFDGFRKEHQTFRKEHESFKQEHQAIGNRINDTNKRQDNAEKHNTEQQRQIDMLLYHVSLVTNGLWDNVLLWVNDSEWSNIKGIGEGEACNCPGDTQDKIEALQKGLTETNQKVNDDHVLIVKNQQNIDTLKEESLTEHRKINYQLRAIDREQKTQNENTAKIGEHFSCFADGLWGDLFVWHNHLLWANETGVINSSISEINTEIQELHQELNEANKNISDNRQSIKNNKEQIECNINDIAANKKDITVNQAKTENDINLLRKNMDDEHKNVAYQFRAIDRKQKAQDDEMIKLGGNFGCFADGKWGDLFLWDNNHVWINNPIEIQKKVIEYDNRLEALEKAITQMSAYMNIQQSTIEKQQEQLEAMLDLFTVTNVGKWQNPLLWNNITKWSNSLITEQ